MSTKEEAMQRYRRAIGEMETARAQAGPLAPAPVTDTILARLFYWALVDLLARKGVITEDEIYAAIADAMELEAKECKKSLAKEFGLSVPETNVQENR